MLRISRNGAEDGGWARLYNRTAAGQGAGSLTTARFLLTHGPTAIHCLYKFLSFGLTYSFLSSLELGDCAHEQVDLGRCSRLDEPQ